MAWRQLFVAFLFVFVFSNDTFSQNLKDLLDKGDRLFSKKDYENALKPYLDALKLDSSDAKTNFRVGMSYLHGEKKGKAVRYLEKAYNTHPEVDEDIDYHLGMAYQNSHQYKKAITHYSDFKRKNRKLLEIADH